MSEFKHTPGPWRTRSMGPWTTDSDLGGHSSWAVGTDRGVIAIAVTHEHHDDPEYTANARLIAAAPMLLEAADDTLEALKLLLIGLSTRAPETIPVINAHIEELSYAIAKATGQ